MLNHIAIHGRLTANPELRKTQSQVSVTSFTVAVDRSYKKDEEKITDFFSVVAWRGLAEMICKYFAKGKEIVVFGSMQSRHYEDKDGNKRIAWEILADEVDFCGSKSTGAIDVPPPIGAPAQAQSPVPTQAPVQTNLSAILDDQELPF